MSSAFFKIFVIVFASSFVVIESRPPIWDEIINGVNFGFRVVKKVVEKLQQTTTPKTEVTDPDDIPDFTFDEDVCAGNSSCSTTTEGAATTTPAGGSTTPVITTTPADEPVTFPDGGPLTTPNGAPVTTPAETTTPAGSSTTPAVTTTPGDVVTTPAEVATTPED